MRKQLLHLAASWRQRRPLLLLLGAMVGLLAQAQPSRLNFTVDARNAEWLEKNTTIVISDKPDFRLNIRHFSYTARTVTWPDGSQEKAYMLDSPYQVASGTEKLYYRLACPALATPIVEDSIDLTAIGSDWKTHYPRQNASTMVVDLELLQGKVPVEIGPTVGFDGNYIPSCIYMESSLGTDMACMQEIYGEEQPDGTRDNFVWKTIYATPGQTIHYVTLPMVTSTPNSFLLSGGDKPLRNYNFKSESNYLLHADSLVVTGNNDFIQTYYTECSYRLGVKDLDGNEADMADDPSYGNRFNCNYRCGTETFTEHGTGTAQEVGGVRLTLMLEPRVVGEAGRLFYEFHAREGKQVIYYRSGFGHPFSGRFDALLTELHLEFANQSVVWADYSQLDRMTVRFKGAAAIEGLTVGLSKYILSNPDGDRHYFEDETVMQSQEYQKRIDGEDICLDVLCSPVYKYITVYPTVSLSDVTLPATTAAFGQDEIVYDLTPYISSGIGTPQLDDTPQAVYSIDGRRLPTLQRGVNIVRRADGTVSKVLVK